MTTRQAPAALPPGVQEHSLRHALREQVSVIWALMMREVMTRFGRHKLGYLWVFLEPTIHIGVWFVIRLVIRAGGGAADMSPWLFLGTGVMPLVAFMHMNSYVGGAISANGALLAFPPVKTLDTIAARFLLESGTLIVVAVVLFTGLIAFGVATWPDSLGTLALAGGGMALLGLGFGICKAIATAFFPVAGQLNVIVVRGLYLTSGIFFDPEKLPPDMQYWLSFNPCLHGVQLFRHGYSNLYVTNLADPWYLFSWALGLVALGLLLERITRHRMKDLP